jgi:hypothetical protein
MRTTPPARSRGRAALGWALGMFVALQAVLLARQYQHPECGEPVFGHKLGLLQTQLAAAPGRPLVLLMGTSRTIFGIRPDCLSSCRAPGGETPVVFNFGEVGTGPLYQLLCLHRLLARGIHPDSLLLEVWPCHLSVACQASEFERLAGQPLEWSDLRVLRRYGQQPGALLMRWLAEHVSPWYTHRRALMARWANTWLPPELTKRSSVEVDCLGWHSEPALAGPEKEYLVQQGYRPYFTGGFRSWTFSPLEDRALREIAALCRQRGIVLTLMYLPEGTEFQSRYPPAVRTAADAYLTRLSKETAVPLVNARDWMPDSAFVDSFHLSCEGAQAFTERFGREVLQPLLGRRKPEPAEVTYRARSTPSEGAY